MNICLQRCLNDNTVEKGPVRSLVRNFPLGEVTHKAKPERGKHRSRALSWEPLKGHLSVPCSFLCLSAQPVCQVWCSQSSASFMLLCLIIVALLFIFCFVALAMLEKVLSHHLQALSGFVWGCRGDETLQCFADCRGCKN